MGIFFRFFKIYIMEKGAKVICHPVQKLNDNNVFTGVMVPIIWSLVMLSICVVLVSLLAVISIYKTIQLLGETSVLITLVNKILSPPMKCRTSLIIDCWYWPRQSFFGLLANIFSVASFDVFVSKIKFRICSKILKFS